MISDAEAGDDAKDDKWKDYDPVVLTDERHGWIGFPCPVRDGVRSAGIDDGGNPSARLVADLPRLALVCGGVDDPRSFDSRCVFQSPVRFVFLLGMRAVDPLKLKNIQS